MINLFAVQVISYLVPLLQVPYLSRVLGVDGLGLYIFSLSLISFLSIITNFGFDVYLPQKIASEKIEGIDLNKLFTGTLMVRSVLFLFVVFFLLAFGSLNNNLKENKDVMWMIIFSIFGNTYTLLWLYQAKECIYIYARIALIAKIISMALIYIFVDSSDDVGVSVFFIGVGNLFTVFFAKWLAYRKFLLEVVKNEWRNVFLLLKESCEFFVSRIFVSFYAIAGGVILGTFSNSLAEVAYYGAAQQLFAAGSYVMSALSTPLAPYMARTRNFNVFFKITVLAIMVTLLGSVFGIFWGGELIGLIFGEAMNPAKNVLDIFMVTIIFSILAVQFGYPALQPLGKVKFANRSVFFAGCLQITLISTFLLAGVEINAVNIAISYLICDIFLSLSRLLVFIKSYRLRKHS